ncbi:hypothetical protein RAAC3_TM7C00001G0614 [Candidatus Saccharibacteria bacterium RAAC3_TM7_1]|nr:hypothetical protein RAAC3_TM7C00001G0614 [Candidatus Saccharibacteria bacterium RAAC3_TM7_1]HCZ28391.1 methyltransferase domain-containing protein [Candidatus Saccharibacteria bacterium]
MARLHTYSQHFLKSPRLVAELAGHSNIRKNDLVYDLGAGSGVISSALARRCKQVVAVEIEPLALEKLHKNVGNLQNVTILKQDILTLNEPDGSYKIFANIPFSLSAEVIKKFTESPRPPKTMYLIVQKQFARKLVPGDDHFTSLLSAQVGMRFVVRIRKPLNKTDFTPPPAVDTVLLELKLRDEPLVPSKELESYRRYVEECFSRQKYFAEQPLAAAGISPELRPSQLTLEQWVALWTAKTKK